MCSSVKRDGEGGLKLFGRGGGKDIKEGKFQPLPNGGGDIPTSLDRCLNRKL